MANDTQRREFTALEIETLRREWDKIQSVDPCGQGYKKLVAFLDVLPQSVLKQLVDAKIKWVSRLALNRVR